MSSSRLHILAAFAILILWFFNLGHNRLTEPDEGRYSEIPREMLASGDWLTPRLNGIKYFEKPPLQYWMTAIAFSIFGENEFSARLWPALTAVGTAGAVYLFAFWSGGALAGALSALILLSSPLMLIIGHINTLDMGLTFFLTLTMLSMVYLIRPNLAAKKKTRANLVLWSACALGVLSKGLVALVVPGIVIVAYILWRRDFTVFKNTNWFWGPLLFFALSAPWFVAVSLKNPEFARFFFFHEHFERFLTKSHDREGPPWYFIPILIAGYFPWGLALLGGVKSDNSQIARNERLFLIFWAAIIFLFFSVSSSKLPPYILPIWPALALLTSHSLTQNTLWIKKYFPWVSMIALITIGVVVFWKLPSYQSAHTPPSLYLDFSRYVGFASIALIAVSGTMFTFYRRWETRKLVLSLAVGALLFWQIILWGYETLSPSYSGYKLSQVLREQVTSDTPIYAVECYVQSLPFYLKRSLIIVNTPGELEFGLNQGDVPWYPHTADFIKKWPQMDNAAAILGRDAYQQIKSLPHRVIYQDLRRIAVVRR